VRDRHSRCFWSSSRYHFFFLISYWAHVYVHTLDRCSIIINYNTSGASRRELADPGGCGPSCALILAASRAASSQGLLTAAGGGGQCRKLGACDSGIKLAGAVPGRTLHHGLCYRTLLLHPSQMASPQVTLHRSPGSMLTFFFKT
jgi:hypothetical protein